MDELRYADLLRAEHRLMTLSAGTKLATGQVSVIGFDMDAPAFTGIVREIQDSDPKSARNLGAIR